MCATFSWDRTSKYYSQEILFDADKLQYKILERFFQKKRTICLEALRSNSQLNYPDIRSSICFISDNSVSPAMDSCSNSMPISLAAATRLVPPTKAMPK